MAALASWLSPCSGRGGEEEARRDLSRVIGATHVAGTYSLSDELPYLEEGARRVLELGSRVIKLYLYNPPEGSATPSAYSFHSDWPECETLVDLARTPYFRRVFEMPFETYVLTVFSAGRPAHYWRGGVTSEQAADETRQLRELAQHLLETYADRAKTFVISHWEGDWAIRGSFDAHKSPGEEEIRGMIAWLAARQKGVEEARAAAPGSRARVLHAAEVNRVVDCMDRGMDGVTNRVLPHVAVDLVSYSAYDAQDHPAKLRRALDYIAEHAVDSAELGDRNVYIGETGHPENQRSREQVVGRLESTLDVALEWGCPWVIYWQVFCNEALRRPVTSNDDVRGFWLVRPDGSPSWAHEVLRRRIASSVRQEALVVRESVRLDARRLERGIVVEADGIVVDGGGCELVGPGVSGDLESFTGLGIQATGRRDVTLRNFRVRGFRTGLRLVDCSGWTIEDCDLSGNYHDPEFGWGDGERVGGVVLDRVSRSVLRRCRARDVWNGLDLLRSDDNLIEDCAFFRCSNVCLKLETSSRNRVLDCDLSWGLRIRSGEVHARDSTCVLIESGSNDNRIERCDITHGGDGIFVRVLNGWCSTGNVFVENDCSYANNNAVESWSPGNTWIRNKANHSSYGFWLGGSDHTVLIGNEAAYNGLPDGFHNAPESDFGHGGIVIVHGSGTHTIIDGNDCHHNAGGGIVFRGDLATRGAKWPMYHLVIQRNRLAHNRYGIFGRFADWVHLSSNTFEANEEDLHLEAVSNLVRHEDAPSGAEPPEALVEGPRRGTVGALLRFDASESRSASGRPLQFVWDVGGPDWTVGADRGSGPVLERRFDAPGLRRVGLTVHDGRLADLAWVDLLVTAVDEESATESADAASLWSVSAARGGGVARGLTVALDSEAVVGERSLRLRAEAHGGRGASLRLVPAEGASWDLRGKRAVSFWLRYRNENIYGFRGPNPIVRLESGDAIVSLVPSHAGRPRNLLLDSPWPEAREEWLRVEAAFAGSEEFRRAESYRGEAPAHFSAGLRFRTSSVVVEGRPVETQSESALVSGGGWLWLASIEGERFSRSRDGSGWEELPSPSELGGHPDWRAAGLAFAPGLGEEGSLLLRRRHPDRDERGESPARLAVYDVAASRWSWLATEISANQAQVVVGEALFGISASRLGNFGGPVTRVALAPPPDREERTVLRMRGVNGDWLGPPARFAVAEGVIWGVKNDWSTPQPDVEPGDRLFRWSPGDFRPSRHVSGRFDDPGGWEAVETPADDLGPLPFEIGRGAALVALPPDWCEGVGAQGGVLVVAGCSPANQDGFGAPSARFAIRDHASGVWREGSLPGETGSGSSATFHEGRVLIKRGGMNFAPSNAELWVVEPVAADALAAEVESARERRFDAATVEALTIELDSNGRRPYTVWVDGLRFEER